jgi:threonine dehydrogenase-like Zn-dependent dehydrogenase
MHAQRAVIPAHGCHPLPDDVPWDIAVLLSGDGLGVPYHTATKVQDPAARTVAVFGVGPIGLGNALMQCWLGREVIAIDVAPARLGLARAVGAAHTVDAARENVVERVRELSGGRGADVCIEAAGRPETLRQCFEAVRKGGQILINGEQPKLELSPSEDFVRRDITATGAWFYHFAEFPRMLELYRQGLPVGRLVTHRYPLEQADEAFREFAAGRTGKVLLAMQPT